MTVRMGGGRRRRRLRLRTERRRRTFGQRDLLRRVDDLGADHLWQRGHGSAAELYIMVHAWHGALAACCRRPHWRPLGVRPHLLGMLRAARAHASRAPRRRLRAASDGRFLLYPAAETLRAQLLAVVSWAPWRFAARITLFARQIYQKATVRPLHTTDPLLSTFATRYEFQDAYTRIAGASHPAGSPAPGTRQV